MLKEGIETIVGLAAKQSLAHIVQVPGDPRNAFLVLNGKAEPIVLPPALRTHTVFTAEDLIAIATLAPRPAVFHCERQVVLLIDHDDRRERVTMPLTFASTFQVLQGLAQGDPGNYLFQPKQLASLLKVELAGTSFPDDVIKGLRKLRWRTGTETRQEFGHGRESIGKDVEAEVTADVELPEFVELETPVYDNPGEDRTHPVRCILDPQPLLQKIAFRPVPGELEEAIKLAQGTLRGKLQAGLRDVPIYFGEP